MSSPPEDDSNNTDSEIEPPSSADTTPTQATGKKKSRFKGMRSKFKKKEKEMKGKKAAGGTEDSDGSGAGDANASESAGADGKRTAPGGEGNRDDVTREAKDDISDEDIDLAQEAATEKLLDTDENSDKDLVTPAGFNPQSTKRPKGWAFRTPIPVGLPLQRWRLALYISSGALLVEVCAGIQVTCLYYGMCYNTEDPANSDDVAKSIVPIALALLLVVIPQGFATSETHKAFHAGVHFVLSTVACITTFVLFSIAMDRYGKNDTLSQEAWAVLSVRKKGWYNDAFAEFQGRMERNMLAAAVSSVVLSATLLIMSISSGRMFLPWLRRNCRRGWRRYSKSLPV